MTVKERGLAGLDYVLLHSLLSSLFWAAGLAEVIKCGKPGSSTLCKPHLYGDDGYEVGAIVDYQYKNDTMVYSRGPLRRVCLPEGVWSGEMPYCYSKIENREFWREYVNGNTPTPLHDDNKSTCFTVPGEYSLELKKQLFIRSILISLEGRNVPKVDSHNESCTFKKMELIHRISSREISTFNFECKNFRSKTIFINPRDSTMCEIQVNAEIGAECISPDLPYNAVKRKTIGNPTRYTIECNKDYQLIGASELTCNDGTWTPPSPRCELIVDCGEVPEVRYGKLIYNSTKVNSTALVDCDEGRMPSNGREIHCLPTGQWTSYEVSCIYIECDPKPSIPNGKGVLLHGLTLLGSKLLIECDKGYAAKDWGIRECLDNGTWGHIAICEEITCDSKKMKNPSNGKWISFNTADYVKVLVCDQKYYIKGTPPVSLCQSNGSWSYTTATCMRIPTNEAYINGLSPNTILLIAVAVGAGTAIFVLSLAMCVLIAKKKRHKMANSSVFHVGTMESTVYEDTNDKMFFKTNPYEEVIEMRNNPSAVPRKPTGTALPLIPIDTDPVYAQPFEATGEKVKTPAKNTADLYTAHIYAEPVDSQLPTSALRTSLAKESWLQNGAINLGRKISLPGQSQTSEPHLDDYAEISKYKNCSSNRSSTSDTFKELNIFSPKRPDTFTGLINNSIYLDIKDRSLTLKDDPERLNMINNEIYRENFSHA